MSKILGLDIGTNSIGWAVVDTKEKKIIAAGVNTFQAGVKLRSQGGQEEALNVARRNARQRRRQVFYKDYRLTKMTEVLAHFGMFPYLKSLDNPNNHEKIISELKTKFNLTDQQLKNYKLNKFKDAYQLNARIAKIILQEKIGEKTKEIKKEELNTTPNTLDDFIQHLIVFKALEPYELRSKAVNNNITKIEFGRILYHLCKRRGFKSSRKVKNKEEDNNFKEQQINKDNKYQDKVKKLQNEYGTKLEVIDETDKYIIVKYPKKKSELEIARDKTKKGIKEGNYITLGNYLFHKNSHIERIRQETKADRSLYVDEFNFLWNKHAEYLGLNVMSGEKWKKKKEFVEITLKEFLGDERKGILFYQRPLKSQKHLVGACNFSNKVIRFRNNENNIIIDEKGNEMKNRTGNSRCLISHPLFESFRSLQQINNLRIKRNYVWDKLSQKEREDLLQFFTDECNEAGKVSIGKVCTKLGIEKSALKGAAESDIEDEELSNFAGNYSRKKLSSLFGERWNNFSLLPEQTQNRITQQCIRKIGGEAFNHNFSFQREKSKEERKTIVEEEGKKFWEKLKEEERNKLLLDYLHEEIWHKFSFYEDNELLFENLQSNYGLEKEKEEEVKKINLKSGYASLSLRAIRKILPFMEQGMLFSHAVFFANLDEVFGRKIWKNTPDEQKKEIYEKIKDIMSEHYKEKLSNDVVNAVAEKVKEKFTKTQRHLDDERIRYFINNNNKTKKYFETFSITEYEEEKFINSFLEQVKEITTYPSSQNYLKKIEPIEDRVKNYLKKTYNIEEERLNRLWHPAKIEVIPPSPIELPEPKFKTLRNPIVKQALYTLRSIIKNIEKDVIRGKPDMVRIELVRELNNKNKRIAIRRWNKKQEEERNKIKERLAEYPDLVPNNEEDIKKYKLWSELQEINGCHICPYTKKNICFDDLFYKNKFQIDHIIPRSRSWSDALVNLTLCDTEFNNNIKKEFTPFEIKDRTEDGFNENWFRENGNWHYKPLQGWRKKATELSKEIDDIKNKLKGMQQGEVRDAYIQEMHFKTFERNYYEGKYRRFISSSVKDIEEMIKSQLTDASYITKLTTQYLKTYYGNHNVEAVKGATTTMLREEWDLGDKNRDNHYHHAEDAIIIALTDLATYMELAKHRKKEKQKGKFRLPWGGFKQQFADAINNIMVYSKQRKKKITTYYKTLVQKGKKKKIKIKSVRGELHESNPYGKLKLQEIYTFRKPLKELSERDWKTKIPKTLNWVALDEQFEQKKITKIQLKGDAKSTPFSKLYFKDIERIQNEEIRELIKEKVKDLNLNENDLIPKSVTSGIKVNVESKGHGQIKICNVKIIVKGKEKIEGRKLTKEAKKGKLLRFNEVLFIIDEAIQNAVINRLKEITFETEKLKKEFGEEKTNEIIKCIEENNFILDEELPNVFYEKKLYRSLKNFGVPVKKVTFKERDAKGHRVRKKIEDLTYGDILNITEPAQTIIKSRLQEINAENGEPFKELPPEFYEKGIYIPVKNVRTHNKGRNPYPIKKQAYFIFGNTDHVKIYKDKSPFGENKQTEYFVVPVPFYFVLHPEKFTKEMFLHPVERINNADLITTLRKDDYVVLNIDEPTINEIIKDESQYFRLKENLYKVTMIYSGGFDIQFRKHYATESDKDVEVNIKSSDGWKKYNPLPVTITSTGKILPIKKEAEQ